MDRRENLANKNINKILNGQKINFLQIECANRIINLFFIIKFVDIAKKKV